MIKKSQTIVKPKWVVFFVGLVFISAQLVLAHNELLEMNKNDMQTLQRMLVDKKFLQQDSFTPGVYNDATEKAYDQYRASLATQKYLDSKNKIATNSQSTSSEISVLVDHREISFLEYLYYRIGDMFSRFFGNN